METNHKFFNANQEQTTTMQTFESPFSFKLRKFEA